MTRSTQLTDREIARDKAATQKNPRPDTKTVWPISKMNDFNNLFDSKDNSK